MTHEYLSIKKRLEEMEKKTPPMWERILIAIIGGILLYVVTNDFTENSPDLVLTGRFTNSTVIINITNQAVSHVATDLKITGLDSKSEGILLYEYEGNVLKAQQTVSIELPYYMYGEIKSLEIPLLWSEFEEFQPPEVARQLWARVDCRQCKVDESEWTKLSYKGLLNADLACKPYNDTIWCDSFFYDTISWTESN